MDKAPSIENINERKFEDAYSRMLSADAGSFIELASNVPKVDFLKWMVEKKGFLLHGSNNQGIHQLEPRLANCASKEFGNIEAVYAVEDPVLPTFYAIKDMQRFRGIARSGVLETSDNKHVQREYDFSVSREMLDERFWSEGVVYILPRETFEQGHDDDGNLIDEWASLTQVNPVGKIKISTDDFPYFDDIKELEE